MGYKTLLSAIALCAACGPSFAVPPNMEMPSMAQINQDRACEVDVHKVCSEIYMPRPGDDRVLLCLEKHFVQLTDACKRNVESHRKIAD